MRAHPKFPNQPYSSEEKIDPAWVGMRISGVAPYRTSVAVHIEKSIDGSVRVARLRQLWARNGHTA